MRNQQVFRASNRFGLGPRPGELRRRLRHGHWPERAPGSARPREGGLLAPPSLPGPDGDLMERLVALYDGDAFLGPRLEAALSADRMAAGLPGQAQPTR